MMKVIEGHSVWFVSLFSYLFLLIILANASDADPLQDFCIPSSSSNCKNTTLVTADDFVFSGIRNPGEFSSATGFAGVLANAASFPGLNTLGVSAARADLRPGGVNVPHFHPRATEVAYVVKGRVYAGFVDSSNRAFAKVIEKGDLMVFPRGLVHFQMNVGKSTATIIGSFNSQNPGLQRIPNALFGSGISDQVLEKAFGLTDREVASIRRKFLPPHLH